MEEQSLDTVGGGEGGGGGQCIKEEEEENENLTEMAALDAEEDEDEETLPHSEILDIFEEGLAQLVQDPLLCDLPIQVCQVTSILFYWIFLELASNLTPIHQLQINANMWIHLVS